MRPFLVAYLLTLALLAGAGITGAGLLFREMGPDSGIEAAADKYGYSLLSWELRTLAGKWVYEARLLFADRTPGEEDELLRRYFSFGQEIEPGADLRRQRRELEDDVENIIEGRVTAVLEEQALTLEPPLFSDVGIVFPPVDFELDSPPRVLVISPRERIEFERSFLLSAGLDHDAMTALEHDAERADTGVSALVVGTSGVAAYPSIVSETASYGSLVDTVFHEWLHQYLVFFPLGFSYSSEREIRTLNESVANIGARELSRLFFERYGDGSLKADPRDVGLRADTQTNGDDFDFRKEMRSLRREVEGLLERGLVAEAEVLMADKRDEFESKGAYIRRLNQAYFAFHGSYADTPASIDPIGPKLESLLEHAGSPGEFVRLASSVTSEEELDDLLGVD